MTRPGSKAKSPRPVGKHRSGLRSHGSERNPTQLRIDLARSVIAGEDWVIIQGYRLPPGSGACVDLATSTDRDTASPAKPGHDQSTIFAD
jgi:hypothetical protein